MCIFFSFRQYRHTLHSSHITFDLLSRQCRPTQYFIHVFNCIQRSLCTNISHMYVGVKLVNYPHLYYFSHFTHFTLYLRMCEKYQILFNFVLISKFPTSIMETSTLFPRHLEKHKFLLKSIEGVAFLTRDIGNYPCLTEASTSDHYSTTRLQYSVVKIFKNLYELVSKKTTSGEKNSFLPGFKFIIGSRWLFATTDCLVDNAVPLSPPGNIRSITLPIWMAKLLCKAEGLKIV